MTLFNRGINKPVLFPLSEYHERKILVVFIHGLGGSSSTWDDFKRLIDSEEGLKDHIDLAFYCYPTGIFFKRWWKLPNLSLVAEGLKSFLDLRCNKYEKIILACHSMGGLIARRYLLNEIMYEKRDLRVKALLLYAVPNNGSDLANQALIMRLVNKHITQLQKRSDFIRELNKGWGHFNMASRLAVKFLVAGNDAIVDEESAKSYWSERSIIVDISKSHMNIIKVKSQDDLSYTALINEILQLKELTTEDVNSDTEETDAGEEDVEEVEEQNEKI